MNTAPKRYRSFISYSQQDKHWGRRLHNWLETYRVPVGVMVDVAAGEKLGRFFHDEAEMPAATDIAEVVRDAIETAESLIVICSPRSASSQWVAAEIEHFRRIQPKGKIFAVIIDGEPNSGDLATECFPPALRRSSDAPGAMPHEPVGIDVRLDSKARVCARLAAGLLDVDFDDLWQRDRRRAEERQRRVIIGLSVVSAAFAVLAGAAIWFALEANRQSLAAETARLSLQREYLAMLGESAIDEVLASNLDPGVVEIDNDPAWVVLMRRDQEAFIAAREYGRGRVFAVAHDGLLDAARIPGGEAFLRRTIGWLEGPQTRADVVIASGHCEWMALGTEDWLMPGLLQGWGYTIRDEPGPLTEETLRGAGILILGNAWSALQPAELDAVQAFVNDGGGVLLAGLGWSWAEYAGTAESGCAYAAQASNALAAYPMNILGARFGIRWSD